LRTHRIRARRRDLACRRSTRAESLASVVVAREGRAISRSLRIFVCAAQEFPAVGGISPRHPLAVVHRPAHARRATTRSSMQRIAMRCAHVGPNARDALF
jgi:hypothetical protein